MHASQRAYAVLGKLHIIAGVLLSLAIIAYVLLMVLERPSARIGVPGLELHEDVIYLPLPTRMTNISVEEAILLRRSIREYTDDPIKLEHLAMILWSAYGITEPRWGLRASPSAGATYPLEVYVVVGEEGVSINQTHYLKPGVYKYDVHKHALILVKEGDVRDELAAAALGQRWVKEAPVSLVVCAVFERTTRIYGERGRVRYVPMEVGHLGQNVYLMATALGYGTVVVGAFYDESVQSIVGALREEVPMYIIPIGVPKTMHRVSFEDVWVYIEGVRRGQ